MSMAITAMASLPTTTRACLPTPSTSPHTITTFSKPQFKRISLPTSTTISLLSLFTIPNEARAAIPVDQIVSSITLVEQTIDQVQGFLDSAERGLEAIANFLKPGIDAGLPIVQQAGTEALKFASPAFSEASKKAQEALQSSGLDTQPVLTAAKTVADAAQQTSQAIEGAKPIASSTIETISTSDPTVIAGSSGALYVAYLLFPPIWSAISFNFRGYKGTTVDMFPCEFFLLVLYGYTKPMDLLISNPLWPGKPRMLTIRSTKKKRLMSNNIFLWLMLVLFFEFAGDLTPAQTLDLLSTQNYVLIDVRSEKDKDKSGIPRLPSSAKNKMVAIPLEEVPSKIKGLVRNVKRVEAEIAALKISYLKKINKGSNIVILDSYSDSAKIVARKLKGLGFKNTWIVADGFSGGKGWLQSRLGTDSYKVSFAEILSPSRIIPAGGTRSFGTTSRQKLLTGAD
ncbi:calcium sensing receptor, chloroplastic isoform X1 [Trifolium pratense]|uniref:calcium sensing receptor, chloroplastic isoform X1 n=1 Tax=Trifolium pratense TaxID=57577 RepID=UPI001E696AE9|nr:calcium sensing receptor, chloroplastic isoform X1 [Trifolium pratense]